MGRTASASKKAELREENDENKRKDEWKANKDADEQIKVFLEEIDEQLKKVKKEKEEEVKEAAKNGIEKIDTTIKQISDKIRDYENEVREWQVRHRVTENQMKTDLKKEGDQDLEEKRLKYLFDVKKLEERKDLLCKKREEILETIRTATAKRETMHHDHEETMENKEGQANEEIYKSREEANKVVVEKLEEQKQLVITGQAEQLAISDKIHGLNNFRYNNSIGLLDSSDSEEQHDKTRKNCDKLHYSFHKQFKPAYERQKKEMSSAISYMKDKEKLNVLPQTEFLSEEFGKFSSQLEAFVVPPRFQDPLKDFLSLAVDKSELVSNRITELENCFKSYQRTLDVQVPNNLTPKECETDKLKELYKKAKQLFNSLDENVQELSEYVNKIIIPASNEVNEMLNRNAEAICHNTERLIIPAIPGSTNSITAGTSQSTVIKISECPAVEEN